MSLAAVPLLTQTKREEVVTFGEGETEIEIVGSPPLNFNPENLPRLVVVSHLAQELAGSDFALCPGPGHETIWWGIAFYTAASALAMMHCVSHRSSGLAYAGANNLFGVHAGTTAFGFDLAFARIAGELGYPRLRKKHLIRSKNRTVPGIWKDANNQQEWLDIACESANQPIRSARHETQIIHRR